eukprot:4791000-Pleurochrysis_carterae.AAC.2
METSATVLAEIDAAISNHCRHLTRKTCQEPIITLRGLSESGIQRYFEGWPVVLNQNGQKEPIVWEINSPEQLYTQLGKRQWHRYGIGCCKLHLRAGMILGRIILMVQPSFRAWYKRSERTKRTVLIIEYKVVALHESGRLELPVNCHYPDEEQERTKAIAVRAITEMHRQKFPLSARLLKLAGCATSEEIKRAENA